MSIEISRRKAIAGAAAVGVGVPVLAACGQSDSGAESATDTAPSAADSSTTGGASSGAAAGGAALVNTADVPEGGGVILAEAKVVVTQPKAGEFKCFSSICTHEGCPVTEVTDTINCTCHGSKFSIEDGSVVTPPANQPLPEVAIKVDGDAIVPA